MRTYQVIMSFVSILIITLPFFLVYTQSARHEKYYRASVVSLVFLMMLQIFIPIYARLPYYIMVLSLISLLFLNFNVYRAFLFGFVGSGIFLVVEIVTILIVLLLTHYFPELLGTYWGQGLLISFLGLTINLISLKLFAPKIRVWLDSKAALKNHQVTVPLILIASAMLFVIFNVLVINPVFTFKVSPVLASLFVSTLLIFTAIAVLTADKFYKRQLELDQLKREVKVLNKIVSDEQGSIFEKSIEYDLLKSDFGESLIAHYDIESSIYSGVNSHIYVLNDKDTGEKFTLKAMEKSQYKYLDLSEMSSVLHQGLSRVMRHGEGNRYFYSIKPYYTGEDLQTKIMRDGPFTEQMALSVASKIWDVLSHLHNMTPSVVFRDVKPSNIIVSENGDVTLVDVETIRRVRADGASDTVIIGSRGYSPPEQYGFSETTPQSDIYALGATVYFMVTGQTPKTKFVVSEVSERAMSKKMSDFIENCMKFDPTERKVIDFN